MKTTNEGFALPVSGTQKKCAVGETVGRSNLKEEKIPVLSCEGACIRGEIARLAANIVAKQEPYRRACHGELLTVPQSTMAAWVKKSEKTVLIDGCFLRCHGRILEHVLDKENLVQFDALSIYRKYTDRFDIESVPEDERKATAQFVAEKILAALNEETTVTKREPAPTSNISSAECSNQLRSRGEKCDFSV